jgi:hypothetical protein
MAGREGLAMRMTFLEQIQQIEEPPRAGTVKHFHEHLTEHHGFAWGYSWTRIA